jgi:hypothetical protein
MKKEVPVHLDTEDIIALERCLAARDAEEALRFLKTLADQIHYAQATS